MSVFEHMKHGTDWRAVVEQIKARVELAETERYAPVFREHAIEDVRALLEVLEAADTLIAKAHSKIERRRGTWRRRRFERRERARQIREAAARTAARAKSRSL